MIIKERIDPQKMKKRNIDRAKIFLRERLGDWDINANIFPDSRIESFIEQAVIEMHPYIGHSYSLELEDPMYFGVILNYAEILLLKSMLLVEAGRDYSINDNGVSFTPPKITPILLEVYKTETQALIDKMQLLKRK